MTPEDTGPRPIYRIELKSSVAKALRDLERQDLQRIVEKIDALALDPRPRGVEKLKGEENAYRVRTGDFRILYEIHDEFLLVLVIRVGNRRDIYRKHHRGR